LPPMNERPPTSAVDDELLRPMMPPVRVFMSHTDRSTVTVARTTGARPDVSPPWGFTFEIFKCPKKATGQPLLSEAAANTREESADVNSRISIPVCAARTYSSKRCVANSWRLPLAFSTENWNSPMLRYGMRFSVGGNSTRCRTGRCDPPQPRIANRTKEQKGLRCTRIGTSVGGDSEHQHNACRWYDGSLDHSPPWALGASSSRRRGSCLSARPHLRRNDTGNWLRADVGDDL